MKIIYAINQLLIILNKRGKENMDNSQLCVIQKVLLCDFECHQKESHFVSHSGSWSEDQQLLEVNSRHV